MLRLQAQPRPPPVAARPSRFGSVPVQKVPRSKTAPPAPSSCTVHHPPARRLLQQSRATSFITARRRPSAHVVVPPARPAPAAHPPRRSASPNRTRRPADRTGVPRHRHPAPPSESAAALTGVPSASAGSDQLVPQHRPRSLSPARLKYAWFVTFTTVVPVRTSPSYSSSSPPAFGVARHRVPHRHPSAPPETPGPRPGSPATTRTPSVRLHRRPTPCGRTPPRPPCSAFVPVVLRAPGTRLPHPATNRPPASPVRRSRPTTAPQVTSCGPPHTSSSDPNPSTTSAHQRPGASGTRSDTSRAPKSSKRSPRIPLLLTTVNNASPRSHPPAAQNAAHSTGQPAYPADKIIRSRPHPSRSHLIQKTRRSSPYAARSAARPASRTLLSFALHPAPPPTNPALASLTQPGRR